MTVTSLLREHLWSAPDATEAGGVSSWRVHVRAVQLVRMFYIFSAFLLVQSFSRWPALLDSAAPDPIWPAEWIDLVGAKTGVTIIFVLFGVATLVAVALPQLRIARIAYTLGLFQFMALDNGFGKINHSDHAWLWVSAFLILLPGAGRAWRSDATKDQRQQFVEVILLAQMVLLFFYTLTGVWKVFYAVQALFTDDVSAFNLNGFSLIIGRNLLDSGRDTVLGDVLVENPLIGWALFNGTMYLETVSILIVFRPRLHRAWGFGLILFHLGTQAAMGFSFPPNIVLLGLLLVASPLAPERYDLRATVLDLPGVRLLHRMGNRIRRPTSVAAPAT